MLQLPIRQAPPEQVALALANEHVRPHAPQFVVALRLVSQPLVSLPSQLPHPDAHAPSAHVPLEQVALALVNAHARPHAPQFDASVRTSVQRPPQLTCPVTHAHVPVDEH